MQVHAWAIGSNLLELAGGFERSGSVQTRHTHIKDDDVWIELAQCDCEPETSGENLRVVTGPDQDTPQRLQCDKIVIDDENSEGGHESLFDRWGPLL